MEKTEIMVSMQAVTDGIIWSLRRGLRLLAQLNSHGMILTRDRFKNELLSWGMPERLAYWLVWTLPYKYIVFFVRIFRR